MAGKERPIRIVRDEDSATDALIEEQDIASNGLASHFKPAILNQF